MSTTNWHFPRALSTTEHQRHLPSASMEIERHAAVDFQQSLREFRWTANGLNHTYTCFHSPPQTPLPSRLPHNIEQSSLCCTVGSRSCSVTQSCPTLCNPWTEHARLSCPSPSPGAFSNPCPLSQ